MSDRYMADMHDRIEDVQNWAAGDGGQMASQILGGISAVTGVLAVVATATGVGAPLGAVLAGVSVASGLAGTAIDCVGGRSADCVTGLVTSVIPGGKVLSAGAKIATRVGEAVVKAAPAVVKATKTAATAASKAIADGARAAADAARKYGAKAKAYMAPDDGHISIGGGRGAGQNGLVAPYDGQPIFRVYGDAFPGGKSRTPVDPRTVSNFRAAAGLPSGGASGFNNSGRFLIEGKLRSVDDVTKVQAVEELDGNPGGLTEYHIPNWMNTGAVDITNVSGLNPEL